ncbi:hypothetical protein [Methylosinus sp. KRF6]|uniref:hypothetical protein n=1 Tax=Methylosinus sp. KRF6 TaxID=2846853 RepID=UPI001C0A9DC2|nr:hypothetical protein [Methylosinus sp. KRF6]MBU3887200.1 hypothetical protein [Methylosinus sp. KRF6]
MELETIHKAIFSKEATVAELEAALNALASHKSLASGERDAICKKRHDLLLAGNEKECAKVDVELTTIDRRRERLDAMETALAERVARVREATEKAEIAELREKALKLNSVARHLLETEYSSHARAILDILVKVAEADVAVDRYNRRVPVSEQLIVVEESMRRQGSRPRQELKREQISLWCYPWSGQPLSEALQMEVVDRGEGLGWLRQTQHMRGDMAVELRPFEKVEFIPEQKLGYQPPLAERLALPRLPGSKFTEWNGERGVSPYRVLEILCKEDDLEFESAVDRRTQIELRPITDKATSEPSAPIARPFRIHSPSASTATSRDPLHPSRGEMVPAAVVAALGGLSGGDAT